MAQNMVRQSFGEISESNKTIYFLHIQEQKSHLTYAQAARWLWTLISFDDLAIKPSKEGKESGGKLLRLVLVGLEN
ncbi:MAG: hypothetical protein ACLTCP_00540 [Ruminococcus bicirculans (ex Wegman et al. 2014)]